MASCRIQDLLALEIPRSPRQANNCARAARSHPTNEQGRPIMGCSTNPRRAAQARLRSRGVDRIKVHDPAPWTGITELADIPAQSRARVRAACQQDRAAAAAKSCANGLKKPLHIRSYSY